MRIVGPSSGQRDVAQRRPARWRRRSPPPRAARCGIPCRPGEEEDDREADVLPGDHDEERVEDEPEVGEPELDEPAEADRPQRRVDEPVRLQDLEEDDRRDRLREHVRREEDEAQDAAAAQRPVEQQRDPERERELEAERERDEDRVVLHRLAEGGVAERLAVVVEPDEVGQRPEPVPGVEAVVNGLDDRDDDEDDVERDRRPDVQADLEPLPAQTADGRPRSRAAGRQRFRTGGYVSSPYCWLLLLCRRRDLAPTTCCGVALPANWSAIASSSACPIAVEYAMSR